MLIRRLAVASKIEFRKDRNFRIKIHHGLPYFIVYLPDNSNPVSC